MNKFERNILVVGIQDCGKTTFALKLALFIWWFYEWVACISLKAFREETQSCFPCYVEFYYPTNVRDLEDIFEHLKKIVRSSKRDIDSTNDTICFGEKKIDGLIAMDKVWSIFWYIKWLW